MLVYLFSHMSILKHDITSRAIYRAIYKQAKSKCIEMCFAVEKHQPTADWCLLRKEEGAKEGKGEGRKRKLGGEEWGK